MDIKKFKEKIDDWALDYVPGSIYRIPAKTVDFFRTAKWMMQRVLRSHHCSDRDLWNLMDRLGEIILPKLKAFKRAPRHGFPASFCEYEEPGPWKNKEEYDKAIANGSMVGGGPEKWEETLNEMIFAFEWLLAERGGKYEKHFFKKYNCDWHAKKPENRSVHYEYRNSENGQLMITGKDDTPPEEPWVLVAEKDSLFGGKKPFYFDAELHRKMAERAQNGMRLFGEYFFALWD